MQCLTTFPLDCQILKNDNSQHNNSCPAWINQLYLFSWPDWQKPYFLVCCRILVISLCGPWDAKGWKSPVWTALWEARPVAGGPVSWCVPRAAPCVSLRAVGWRAALSLAWESSNMWGHFSVLHSGGLCPGRCGRQCKGSAGEACLHRGAECEHIWE